MKQSSSLLLPIVCKLKAKGDNAKFKEQLNMLEQNIHEITAPFGHEITREAYGLTVKEIEICNMIKNGLSTKEIATSVHCSPLTVEKHRSRIRNSGWRTRA